MLDTAKTESPAGFRLQSTQCQGHGRGCRKRAGARVALRSPKTGGDNEEASQPLYTPLRTRKHSEANAQRDLNKRRRRKKKNRKHIVEYCFSLHHGHERGFRFGLCVIGSAYLSRRDSLHGLRE